MENQMDPHDPKYDGEEIERAIELICGNSVVELRVLEATRNGKPCGTVSGYFDANHRDKMMAEAIEWCGYAKGIYITLNPLAPELLSRCSNRVKTWARETTKDNEVICRNWLPLDFDPVRPSGI